MTDKKEEVFKKNEGERPEKETKNKRLERCSLRDCSVPWAIINRVEIRVQGKGDYKDAAVSELVCTFLTGLKAVSPIGFSSIDLRN